MIDVTDNIKDINLEDLQKNFYKVSDYVPLNGESVKITEGVGNSLRYAVSDDDVKAL